MLGTLIPVKYDGVVLMMLVKRITSTFVVFEYNGDEIICPLTWGTVSTNDG